MKFEDGILGLEDNHKNELQPNAEIVNSSMHNTMELASTMFDTNGISTTQDIEPQPASNDDDVSATDSDTQFTFTADDIQDLSLNNEGALVIKLSQGEGTETVVIENFEEIANGPGCFKLADGAEINAQALYTDLCNEAGICTIERPAAGSVLDVPLEGDKQYDLKFSLEDGQNVSRNPDSTGEEMTLTFEDGAQIKFQTAQDLVENGLNNDDMSAAEAEAVSSKFMSALDVIKGLVSRMEFLEQQNAQTQGGDPEVVAELASVEDDLAAQLAGIEPAAGVEAPDDNNLQSSEPDITNLSDEGCEDVPETVALDDSFSTASSEQPLEIVAAEEPEDQGTEEVADMADQVAQIEPAAGEGDTGGGASNTGFGFQSSFDPQGVIPLDDVGPIDPTALQYGVPTPELEVAAAPSGPAPEAPDDQPIVLGGRGCVDETNMNGGSTSWTGQVFVDFGNDGPGTITGDGTFDTGGATSGGVPIEVTYDPATGTYTGTAGGADIFTLEINADGSYTFTLTGPIDHPDGSDPNDVLNFTFGVLATDADGDQSTGIISMDIYDDGPEAQPYQGNAISEQDLPAVITNQLNIDFGEDGAGSVEFTGQVLYVPVMGEPPQTLMSGGQPVSFGFNADGELVGSTPDGTVVFTIVMDPLTGEYTFTLFEGIDHGDLDVSWLLFEVLTTEGDGDTASSWVSVDVYDADPDVKPDVVEVDETDDGVLVAKGDLDIDFGGDGAGAATANGRFAVTDENGDAIKLTSGGEEVSISATADGGYVGMLPDGTVAFTLTIDPTTGEYVYTQNVPFDHPDGTDHDDAINLILGIQVTDRDGDVVNTTITVVVKDDGPEIHNKFGAIDEDGLVHGPISYTKTLDFDFGNDGAGSIEPTGNFQALFQVGGQNQTLTSGGEEVVVTATPDGYVGMLADGTVVFTLVIDSQTGEYTYTQYVSIDHPDPNNPDDVIWLKFGVGITDGDNDTDTAFIVVDLHDGGPSAVAAKGGVREQGLDDGSIGVTGQVDIEFGPDGAGSVDPSGRFAVTAENGEIIKLTSGGEEVSVTATDTGYVGTLPDGTVVFHIAINPETGEYRYVQYEAFDHLEGDDLMSLNFGLLVTDGDGDSVQTSITIVVGDDAPIAKDDCETIEVNSVLVGDVTDNDNLSQDADNTVIQVKFGTDTYEVPADGSDITIVGEYGTLTINSSGQYSYVPFDGGSGGSATMNPTQADTTGIQSSLTLNGITVAIANAGNYDISWVDTADGSGLGIDNLDTNDSHKVWPTGETFDISAEQNVTSMTITISELGPNNSNGHHGLDYVVTLADGTQVTLEQQFVPSQIIDGHFTFTIDSADFGQEIVSVSINSTNAGEYLGASFLLNNVSVEYQGTGYGTDVFEYVLQDGDGDTDIAQLKITTEEGGPQVLALAADIQKVDIAEHDAINIDDVLYGKPGADLFIFDAISKDGGVTKIKDFDMSEGDRMDLSALITGYDAVADDITEFVKATEVDGDTYVSVDPSGSADKGGFELLAVLEGVTGLEIDASIKADTGNV